LAQKQMIEKEQAKIKAEFNRAQAE